MLKPQEDVAEEDFVLPCEMQISLPQEQAAGFGLPIHEPRVDSIHASEEMISLLKEALADTGNAGAESVSSLPDKTNKPLDPKTQENLDTITSTPSFVERVVDGAKRHDYGNTALGALVAIGTNALLPPGVGRPAALLFGFAHTSSQEEKIADLRGELRQSAKREALLRKEIEQLRAQVVYERMRKQGTSP